MTPKLFRAVDVCEIAQLQPYVLRSWEKEFPGIGVQKSPDIDQVQKIKQLVFGEGLTLSGARRRLEQVEQSSPGASDEEVAEVLEALASDARTRIAHVRDGLRSILKLLSAAPGTVVVVDDYRLTSPAPAKAAPRRSLEARPKSRVIAKQVAKRGSGKSAASSKRGKRASA